MMCDIVKLIGIEVGSIYYYFDFKEEILNKVFDIGIWKFYEFVIEIISLVKENCDDFCKIFVLFIEMYLIFFLIDSDFILVNI